MANLTKDEYAVLYCYADRCEAVIEGQTGFSREKVAEIEKALLEKGLLEISINNFLNISNKGNKALTTGEGFDSINKT